MDNSLLTAVLLGVLLVWLLNEWFGWPQSGLVVPGYLAAVFAIRPETGAVIVGEALLTYALARLLVDGLPRLIPLGRAFGRDRFFLILLLSVGVRLFVEGGGLHALLASLGFSLDLPLHSLGLVLVPLLANAFWQPGALRGVPLMGLPVLAVYLVLQFVLLPHTNLNFSNFELTYENLSLDFLSAPRAYMLLLSGALLATWASRFGWDTGGILIPGLLAITWLHPGKLLATAGEVTVIVLLLHLLLALPLLRSANLAGMRPLVLAFTTSYLVKLALSAVLGQRYPGLRVTDLFGFGYLLPSLLAIRAWRYASLPRALLPAAGISLAAFLLGSGVGVGMEALRPLPEAAPVLSPQTRKPGPAWRAATELLLPPARSLLPPERDELREALHLALRGQPYQGRYVYADSYRDGVVLHSGDRELAGVAWVRPAGSDLAVLVPDAAREPGLAEAAVVLANTLDARLLLLSPAPALRVLALRESGAVMELRLAGRTRIAVAGRLPRSVDLNRLSVLLPELSPSWDLDRELGLDVRLELSEDDLLEVALRGFRAEPSPELPPLYREEGLPIPPSEGDDELVSPTTLYTLGRAVLQPLLRARGDERWAELAAAQAARMDLLVHVEPDLLALGPAPGRHPPRFTLWLARAPESSLIFEVRAGRRHYLAAEVARSWWAASGGEALLVHDAGADLDSDALLRLGERAPELQVLRALVLEHPESTVVSVAAYSEEESPGADAILSIGRPLTSADRLPAYLEPVRRLVLGSGGSVGLYDGSQRRLRYYDPSNPRRKVVEYAGGHYVTVYLSPTFRRRFAGPSRQTALEAALSSAHIPLGEGSVEAALEGEPLEGERAEALFGPLLLSLRRQLRTGHPGELGRLSRLARSRGFRTRAFVDPLDGLPYLLVEGHRARLLAPLSRGRGELAPEPTPEAVRVGGFAAAVRTGRGP